MEFYDSLIKVIVISVLLFTNISFVLKLSFSLYYNSWAPIKFLHKSMCWGWAKQMVKYLNSFNHNWELVVLKKTPIQLQYNSAN